MKKVLIALLLICLACTIVVSLTSCGDGIVGEWSGEWDYNGNHIKVVFDLEDDGKYYNTIIRNGVISEVEKGTYTFDGSELVLHLENSSRKTKYNYSDGKLENAGHYFTKQ